VPIEHNVDCAETYLHTKWHLYSSNRLPQYTWAENGELLCPLFFAGGAGSGPNLMSPGPRPTSLQSGRHLDPYRHLATSDMGRKLKESVPPLWGSWSPSNTMWPGPSLTSIPSGILVHPTVWPQYTNVTDRDTTDRTTVR